jgi:hypothetical protein
MIIGIALWVKFLNGEVLLKQNIYQSKKGNIIYYEPIKEWVKSKEGFEEAIKRIIKENFQFNQNIRLHFEEIKRKYFGISNKGSAVRYHLQVALPWEIDIKVKAVRLIGFQDLLKIKKMSKKGSGEIIMFDEDYQILLKLFGIKSESELTFYFLKSQSLFEHFISPLFVSTNNEPHFGQISPVGLSHKAKSHFGQFEQP